MDQKRDWLEQLLLEERHEVLQLLDFKHKALIAAFQEQSKRDVAEHLEEVSPQNLQPLVSTRSSITSPNIMFKPESTLVVEEDTLYEDINDPEKRQRLMCMFDMIDSDCDGLIEMDEVRAALQSVGQSPALARRLVAHMEVLCRQANSATNGGIQKDDWLRVVEAQSQIHAEICELAERLERRHVLEAPRGKKREDWFMFSGHSYSRFAWDVLCSLCVLYVVFFVPYWIAFDPDDASTVMPAAQRDLVAKIIDAIFLVDILFNFRTSYLLNGVEVRDGRKVALKYVRSWFLLDALASVPVSFLIDSGKQGRPIKLVKFVRLVSVFKVMRSPKAIHTLAQSGLGEFLEDRVVEYRLQGLVKLSSVLVSLFVCSHWLACLMAVCGMHFLDRLSEGFITPGSFYLPSFYWAMTTVTTVGYGDIVPRTDAERIVAMLAMCAGGTFYGVNTSIFASIILVHDRVDLERASRMEIVNHWLRRHRFPYALKRRLRRYFKGYLSHNENSTREELTVFEDLTSDLRLEVAMVLVPEEVRVVPIFACVPNFVTGFMMSILQLVSFHPNEVIVKEGECGLAMFVVLEGHCVKTTPRNPNDASSIREVAKLFIGESFGEEIILNLMEVYSYTVMAQERCDLYAIPENLFNRAMASYPQHLKSMKEFFIESMVSKGATCPLESLAVIDARKTHSTCDNYTIL